MPDCKQALLASARRELINALYYLEQASLYPELGCTDAINNFRAADSSATSASICLDRLAPK